jgi:hypothetical protein
MKDHERRLELVFQGMDTNKDSELLFLFDFFVVSNLRFCYCFNLLFFKDKIGTGELIGYFRQLGIDIHENEAKHLLKK